jgi:hypothetical protein
LDKLDLQGIILPEHNAEYQTYYFACVAATMAVGMHGRGAWQRQVAAGAFPIG